MFVEYLTDSAKQREELEEALYIFLKKYFINPKNIILEVKRGPLDKTLILTPKRGYIQEIYERVDQIGKEEDLGKLEWCSKSDVKLMVDDWRFIINYK